MKKKKLVVLALLCLGIFSLFANNNAFALDENDLLKKVLWRGLSKCYTSKYMLNEVDGTNGGVSLNDIFKDKGKKVDDGAILVFSNGIGNSLTQAVPDVSCKQVFEGYNVGSGSNSIKGLLQLTGKPFDISQLGFIRRGDIPYNVTCFKVKFSVTAGNVSSSGGESNSLCISTEKDATTGKDKLLRENGSWRYHNVVEGDEKLANGVKLGLTLDGSGQLAFIASNGENTTPLYSLTDCATLGIDDSTMDDVGNFKQCIEDSLFYTDPDDSRYSRSMLILNQNADAEQPLFGFEVVQTPVGGPSNGEDNVWKKKNFGAALDALHYFDGPEDMAGIVFTDQEKYDVLLKYTNDTVKNNKNKVGVDLDACYDTAGELGDQYGIPIQNGKWCVINGVDNVKNLQFNVIEAYQNQALRTVNFEGVLKRLKELAPNVDTSGGGVHVGIEEDEAIEETCRNSEGSETLGWILCPMMSMMGKAAEGMYTNMVEQHLMIEPSLFKGEDESSDTRTAWAIFRDIANVLFIILFLVVIFSQLTGIGIDNYGIKKILPRLIVAAVLINLSYLICLLMVDLSNILGSGLRSIFDSLGSSLNPEIVLPDDLHFANSASSSVSIGGVLAGVGIAGALVAVVGVAIWSNPAIILTLLIGLLGVVVAVFFLFFLLGARKAAIIILTVISPLAVVAYMLPNTKKLYDRWMKMFEGLLLVYPIVGLMVGAGDYASRLLLKTSDGFLMWITAMVVSVAPIFFIPTVLKGAFSAMGKVGGMLAGLSSGASKMAKRQVKDRGGEIARKVGGTDRFRMARNAIGMHSLTKRGRARAVRDAAALMRERSERERYADRNNMQTRIDSIAAAEEAKAKDESIAQRLSLMQDTGSRGGIKMNNGNRRSFTLDNAIARMEELEIKARTTNLSDDERMEVAALARGMASMKGGAGALGRIVRNSGGVTTDANGNRTGHLNSSFMSAMGETYASDATVRSKMNEKDVGASAFTEQFMPGGGGLSGGQQFSQGFTGYQADAGYQDVVDNRIKTYDAGLNQGGTAATEYINSLKKDDLQNITNDERLMNSLDVGVRRQVEARAKSEGIGVEPTPALYTDNGHSYTRQANGEWTNESGESMGSDFGTYIEHNQQAQQQIQENAQREEGMQNLSDAQLQTILTGTETGVQAVAKRDAASRESTRRSSLSDEQRRAEEQARNRRQTTIRTIASNNNLSTEQKREEISKLRGESQNAAVRRQIDYRAKERQQQAEVQRQALDTMKEHEEDALRRGRTSITIPPSIISGQASTTIQGYAQPSDFQTGGTWSRSANGDHIYTEPTGVGGTGGRQWNASTGRYVRTSQPQPNPPQNPPQP